MFLYRNRSRISSKSFLLWHPSLVEGQVTKINTEPFIVSFPPIILGNFVYHFDRTVELFGQIPTVRQA